MYICNVQSKIGKIYFENIVNRATRFRHMGPTSVCFIDLLKILSDIIKFQIFLCVDNKMVNFVTIVL